MTIYYQDHTDPLKLNKSNGNAPQCLDLPPAILKLFKLFNSLNFPAWLVGGSLRDLLLNRKPQDWDFATPINPDETKSIFEQENLIIIETGMKHGTLTLRFEHNNYEITTFRKDGPYKDHRHPDWVVFTQSLNDDLSRRDFTINALAYTPNNGLEDPFNGHQDLLDKQIRCVGNPYIRFQEDALRILRGIRLAAQLGFQVETKTALAMQKQAALLPKISWERIRDEFNKILLSNHVNIAFQLLKNLEIWPYIIPQIIDCIDHQQHSEHHYLDIYEHTLKTIENTPKDLTLRLAALFHDIGKPDTFSLDKKGKGHFYGHAQVSQRIAKEAMQRLRYSKEQQRKVQFLIKHHMAHLENAKAITLKNFICQIPQPREAHLSALFTLQDADLRASAHQSASLEEHRYFKERCYTILKSGCPLSIKDLAINGQDLVQLNIPPKQRSLLLSKLLNQVMIHPEANTRDQLLEAIKKLQTGS